MTPVGLIQDASFARWQAVPFERRGLVRLAGGGAVRASVQVLSYYKFGVSGWACIGTMETK